MNPSRRRRSSSKSRPIKSRPKSTHNPSGDIQPTALQWTQEEFIVFDALEISIDRRENTYLAAFLSCWLCLFALPVRDAGCIRPGTFSVASSMEGGQAYCLSSAILASIYRGLGEICRSAHPGRKGGHIP